MQSWTALFRALSSHQQPSAYLNQRTKGILQPPLGQTGQTLMACTVAEWRSLIQESSDFSLVLSSTTDEKLFIPYKPSANEQALKVCLVWPSGGWGVPLV